MHASRRQLPIDVPVAAAQEVAVGGSQITVEECINERINEGVGVAKPQQSSFQPEGHTAALHATDERPGSGHQEERQPAEGEGTNYNAQSGCSLLLPFEDGLVFPLAPLVVLASFEKAGDTRAALLLHLTLELQRRCHTVQALLFLGFLHLFDLRPLDTSRLSRLCWLMPSSPPAKSHHGSVFPFPGEASDGVLGCAELGRSVDPVVHDQHHRHGDVEGHGCRVDSVSKVLADETDPAVINVLRPAEQRGEGDGSREEPHRQDHLGHAAAVLPDRISQRLSDTQIPTQRKTQPNEYNPKMCLV